MTNTKKQRPGTHRFQEILDAAAKIFREKGYHHANILDIAKEVGLKKGSLYHHIKGKEELLYEISMSALGLYVESLKGILVSPRSAESAVREAIIAYMKPMDIQLDYIHVFMNERRHLSKKYRKKVDGETKYYERLWIEILEKGKADGVFRSDLNTKMTMLAIFGMCNWTVAWYRSDARYSITELGEMFAKNILDGIKA